LETDVKEETTVELTARYCGKLHTVIFAIL